MVKLSTIGKYGLIGTIGTLALADIVEQAMGKYDTEVVEPIDTISIIMPSYNEEFTVELASASVREQSIIQEYPDYFEIILVDSSSTDKTVELAEPFIDKVIIAPKGKLTARNIATDKVKGNIIVSVDSDCYYPYHWLNTLLNPFNNLNYHPIAGTVGSTLDYSMPNFPGQLHTISHNIFERMIIRPKQMPGRNSTYYRHLFYLSGRFNENINQFNINQIFKEEECDFGLRLAKFGKIVFRLNATCIHLGGQKISCRIGLENKNVCKKYRIGTDRF